MVLAAISGIIRRFSRLDLVLAAIALTAAYLLIALGILSHWVHLATWCSSAGRGLGLIALFCLFAPRSKDDPDLPAVAPPPLA